MKPTKHLFIFHGLQTEPFTWPGKLSRIGPRSLIAALLTGLALATAWMQASAGWVTTGANGCGNFIDAVRAAQPGDTLAQMWPEKDTDGAVITKSLTVQGGWTPNTACDTENQVFTDTAAMLAFGFAYSPTQRSDLVTFGAPVLTIQAGEAITLENLTLQELSAEEVRHGAGVSATLESGGKLLIRNVEFNQNTTIAGGAGGGLYTELHGGSLLTIQDSYFSNNTADSGGGMEIHIYNNSRLIIEDSVFISNIASQGNGGGGRIVVHGAGFITLRNNTFANNQAGANSGTGRGGGLSIESDGSGPVTVCAEDNLLTTNDPDPTQIYTSGDGIRFSCADKQVFLPMVRRNSLGYSTQITNITIAGDAYQINFTTSGYTPKLPGYHVHFFFDTVPPEEAGMPGSGPWKLYGGPSPFTGYKVADRPAAAQSMCILVANPDHSVQQHTGNCYPLPGP